MKQALIAIDQFFNCVVWVRGDGFGFADETLSARLFRLHLQGVISDMPYRAVDMLFWFENEHCYWSWRSEVDRSQLPGHYRLNA